LNDFEKMLIPSLKFRGWTAQLGEKILNNLKIIPELTKYDFPTFTYVHFITPHPPFIFDRSGNPLDPAQNDRSGFDGDHYFAKNPDKDDYKRKYIDEIIFINGQIQTMVDEILNKSKEPPIIIIQSDHGPGSMTYWEDPEKTNMKERLSILNAYYIPSECKNALYNSITPVNTFRVIFNCLFQTNFEILKDESYFNTWSQPYKFINVTEKILK
jgi:phosphoglycerol transferase MdoB-like AlkP superfamily enzyme